MIGPANGNGPKGNDEQAETETLSGPPFFEDEALPFAGGTASSFEVRTPVQSRQAGLMISAWLLPR
ncbi:hypothetical protein CDO73_11310 [Saccharibacillus sp. O23]|nr:hypothetical protein CDO73_11310 [Saccharibacillus sp. O23]